MSESNSGQTLREITNDTSGDETSPAVVAENDKNNESAPDPPRPTTKRKGEPSTRTVKGSQTKDSEEARKATEKARRAERRAEKLAKQAAFDEELARKSNEKYFTRGRDHLAAVKRQEECEAALNRVRARARASHSTRRIVQEDGINSEDERMALEALAPIQRPTGLYTNRYVPGDSDKENREVEVEGGGEGTDDEEALTDIE